VYAAEVIARHGELADDGLAARYLGGEFTGPNPPLA
jgi:hypothetical protein